MKVRWVLMNTDVKIIRVLNIVWGAFVLMSGLATLAYVRGILALIRGLTPLSGAIVASFGIWTGLIVVATGVFAIYVGIKLGNHTRQSRALEVALGVIQLFYFPVGTLLGVYGLYAVSNKRGRALFEEKPAAEEEMRRAA
jgi:hypothetical protein